MEGTSGSLSLLSVNDELPGKKNSKEVNRDSSQQGGMYIRMGLQRSHSRA